MGTAQIHAAGWIDWRRNTLAIALRRSVSELLKLYIARHQAYPPTRESATNTTAAENGSIKAGLD
jgi:hypothetical protein